MDAPQGRYRVVEKDGRLVVIVNGTGVPITPSVPPPRVTRGGTSSAPVVAGKGAIDSIADALLRLAVKEWDKDGRAVIAWEWKEQGKTKRWDARLDAGQQRRLGRGLLALAAIPLLILSFALLDGGAMWIGIVLSVPFIFRGLFAISRLRRETADQ